MISTTEICNLGSFHLQLVKPLYKIVSSLLQSERGHRHSLVTCIWGSRSTGVALFRSLVANNDWVYVQTHQEAVWYQPGICRGLFQYGQPSLVTVLTWTQASSVIFCLNYSSAQVVFIVCMLVPCMYSPN